MIAPLIKTAIACLHIFATNRLGCGLGATLLGELSFNTVGCCEKGGGKKPRRVGVVYGALTR